MSSTHHLRLAEARHAAGITQTEFAALVGVGQPHIARWEKGHVEPTVSTAITLAAALGTTVEKIWPARPVEQGSRAA